VSAVTIVMPAWLCITVGVVGILLLLCRWLASVYSEQIAAAEYRAEADRYREMFDRIMDKRTTDDQ